MKRLMYIFLLLFTAFSFGQNSGLIVGKIIDNELGNAPLVLANISIKDMPIQADTDLTGLFVIENLKEGDYTLVCSFTGYETQEVNVHVDPNHPVEVKLALQASTVSLDELALLTSVAQKDDKTLTALN